MEKYNYGVIGLGVMGRNLLYNIADHNFSVAGFDLDEEKVKELHDGATSEMKVKGVLLWKTLYRHWKSQEKLFLWFLQASL